jgi:hypothetical protein
VRLQLIALRGQYSCQRRPLPARGDALQDNLRTGNDLQTLGGLWLDRRRHCGEDWQKQSIHQRRAGPAMRAARSPKTCRFRTNISHSWSSNCSAGRRTGNRRAYERRGSCRSAWQGASNSANILRSTGLLLAVLRSFPMRVCRLPARGFRRRPPLVTFEVVPSHRNTAGDLTMPGIEQSPGARVASHRSRHLRALSHETVTACAPGEL